MRLFEFVIPAPRVVCHLRYEGNQNLFPIHFDWEFINTHTHTNHAQLTLFLIQEKNCEWNSAFFLSM